MCRELVYSKNNIIGLIILSIILLNMKANKRKIQFDGKLYLVIILSTLVIMILNIIMGCLNGKSGYLIRETYIIVAAIYFILNPIPYMAWALYTDFYIHKSKRRFKKITPIFAIPAIISIILCILSIFNKGVFFIDENNLYQRGNLFWLNVILYYSYFVSTYIQIIVQRKNINKKDYYSLLTFPILPTLAGILQIVDMSKPFIWLAVSISILIIYLNIQNQEIYEDYLTGLYNRRKLDIYLKNVIRELEEGEFIFVIMIDVNDFKHINDTYGHIEGDNALKHMANILTESFRTEDFISRYAGDEFIVITKLQDENSKEEIISRLRRKVEKFNETNQTHYDINISLGYDIYNPELKIKPNDFIRHIDKLMYKDKERIKGVKANNNSVLC